ncbi:hypothetical protein [Natrinema sp. SYSU A 869]|uniref:hypothetical protein n=1 Tax=Natrinema sp. SYSU A 869 TaxID=2871694 RepID=UPI001CA42BAB|nr:hypothetical protein [Natrinema sp. SYSU A 869]
MDSDGHSGSSPDGTDSVEADPAPIDSIEDRALDIPVYNRVHEFLKSVKESKYQPMKLALILVWTVGFAYWLLVYLGVLSVSF